MDDKTNICISPCSCCVFEWVQMSIRHRKKLAPLLLVCVFTSMWEHLLLWEWTQRRTHIFNRWILTVLLLIRTFLSPAVLITYSKTFHSLILICMRRPKINRDKKNNARDTERKYRQQQLKFVQLKSHESLVCACSTNSHYSWKRFMAQPHTTETMWFFFWFFFLSPCFCVYFILIIDAGPLVMALNFWWSSICGFSFIIA